jgi:hypothetical protein
MDYEIPEGIHFRDEELSFLPNEEERKKQRRRLGIFGLKLLFICLLILLTAVVEGRREVKVLRYRAYNACMAAHELDCAAKFR